ncbi:MerR family transcriptional regulator [Naumannella cuiyingiana]|uniref:DNA-binding transcriptional MerR regulator n=1 Tax=Naumannella cuiyingiana TaxID=1347891 RepID=A0A7Z0D7E0_9ACTN|nr:MerR family DNA-binding transcriptional regulator [Naumannella cuiyingiana]NYI70257.1 DNA-binding transcriptional MerR regulator [Naumannella cuiyingiana]
MAARTWSISELAEEFDTTLRTIRFYEDKGLLAPRREGQRRIYGERERVRLRLVLRGKRLGFALDEIARIVDMYDSAPGEAGQLRYLLAEIAERRAELESRRADIDTTLAELAEVEARCRADLAELGRSGAEVRRVRPAARSGPPRRTR